MPEKRKKTTINKHAFMTMMRDLKTVFTESWFLPEESFEASFNAWHRALGDFSYDELRRAFDEYIRTNEKPPVPSQIRELVYQTADAEKKQPEFSEAEYWEVNNYWVLLDLNGYHLNETVAPTEVSSDTIREWLVKSGYDLTGTILKPVDFKTYKPKYRRVS